MARTTTGVRFFLKTPNEEISPIKVVYCYNNRQFCYYERKLSVPTKYWNTKQQKANQTKLFPGHTSLNDTLAKIANVIIDSHRDLKNSLGREPHLDELRTQVKSKRKFGPIEQQNSINEDLLTFMTAFVSKAENNEHYNTDRLIAAGTTIRSYKQTKKLLESYCRARQTLIPLEEVNYSFGEDISKFLYREYAEIQGDSEQTYSPNTCAKHLSNIKAVMSTAFKTGKVNTMAFRSIEVKRQETDEVYLTAEELKAFYEFDYKSDKRLELARDTFVLGCQLGFRYSDLKAIDSTCFGRDAQGLYIKKVQQKTKDPVYVPVNPLAEKIILKYSPNPCQVQMPRRISEQKFRQYIKEAASKVPELQKMYRRKEYQNVQVVERAYPKWKLISTHTMRRTFATLWSENGQRHEEIMKITGHKSYKSFEKYIKNKSSLSEQSRRTFSTVSLIEI